MKLKRDFVVKWGVKIDDAKKDTKSSHTGTLFIILLTNKLKKTHFLRVILKETWALVKTANLSDNEI